MPPGTSRLKEIKLLLVQQLVNALTLGFTYSLVALGYTLVFGTLGVVNMAHGAIFMAGAFVGYLLTESLGLNLFLSFAGAALGGAFFGALLEFIALRPLRRRVSSGTLAPLLSTIGFGIVLQNVFLTVYGPESRSFAASVDAMPLRVGGISFTSIDLLILAVSIGLMIGLHMLLYRTRLGKAMRAVAESAETASLLGIDARFVCLATVMLASAIGGVAGMLVGLAFAVQPAMGVPYGLKGLAIIVLGGMGSVPGAVLGGLILGFAEVMTVQFLSSSWRDAVAYALLFILLVVRPQGLFGNRAAEGRA